MVKEGGEVKFTFKIQQYQTDAVNAVVDVFQGQPFINEVSYLRDIGRYSKQLKMESSNDECSTYSTESDDLLNDAGFKNATLQLSNEQLISNIRVIQQNSNLHLSDELVEPLGHVSLDIEMETGTGKTYVYIKTIFELNKKYGWSKFIIVVPSIAIREGVKKSFEMTADHFMEQYGKKTRFFVYDSKKLSMIDSFSSNSGINVMIINTQAFAKSFDEKKGEKETKTANAARIIYTERDEFGSRRPIDVISANRPILILDEPQKMGKKDSATQKGLRQFKPLFTLNYSATHATQHNLVYVLDALDAYNQRLVKRIEVKGFEVKNLRGTDSYLYVERLIPGDQKRKPTARIELEIRHKSGIKREFRTLSKDDNLYFISGEMEQYRGMSINDINCFTDTVTFTNGVELRKGDVTGDISEIDYRRMQIRETVISHLEKEKKLFHQGIKILSLFFIDKVDKYRRYDNENGCELLGEYGKIFEEEYNSIVNDYRDLIDVSYREYLDAHDVRDIHCGYFSIDKKTNRFVDRSKESESDTSTYELIMRKKEQLLSFDEPVRFIFSHSALREGWDNPNIFQICTLKHSDSSTQKRQEVGRGLRLCVNQIGTRMDAETLGDRVHEVNELTVIASESYAPFVADLQSDIKKEMYNRPTKATIEYFLNKVVKVNEEHVKIDEAKARAIYRYLVRHDYVDDNDHIKQTYRDDVYNQSLEPLPDELKPIEEGVHQLIQAIYDDSQLASMFKDGNKTKITENPLNERFEKEEFQKLWKAINHKYAYTVEFDSDELIEKAIKHIDDELYVSCMQYTVTYAGQKDVITADMIQEESSFYNAKSKTVVLEHEYSSMVQYDLLGEIAQGAVLTRMTVAKILAGIKPEKFAMYKENPEEFISKVTRLIKEQKATMVVEHITYDTIDGNYDSSIFTASKSNLPVEQAYPAKKAIQDYVFTDGIAEKSVERQFAEALDGAEEVFIYAKLPKGFNIPTPVGHYSPDWAIVFHEGKVKHVYFIAETKGTMDSLNLRPIEKAKIDCAKKLFNRLSDGLVTYDHVDSYQELRNKILK